MIKEVREKIPARPAKVAFIQTTKLIICDFCDKAARQKCSLCKRDLCDGYGKEYHTERDDREWGDYPAKFCPVCAKLKFKKYDKEYWDMQDRHEAEELALDEKILKESLAHGNTISKT